MLTGVNQSKDQGIFVESEEGKKRRPQLALNGKSLKLGQFQLRQNMTQTGRLQFFSKNIFSSFSFTLIDQPVIMNSQAQKRPFASLMEQDYDSELNDNLSPQPSLSPMALDTFTDDSIYTQQHMYEDTTSKIIDHNSYDTSHFNSLLPQTEYQHHHHHHNLHHHHPDQAPHQLYLPNYSHQPSPPSSQPPSISLSHSHLPEQQQQQQQSLPLQQHRQQLTKPEQAYCIKTLTALRKHRKAVAFLKPVDVVAFNIPDYLDIVKQPMDLGTISQKLEAHHYTSVDAFLADIQLIFYNCYLYNNAQDPVSLDAKKLEEVFAKWLEKRPEPQPATIQNNDSLHTNVTDSASISQQQHDGFETNNNGIDEHVALGNNNDSAELDDLGIMPDDQYKLCESTLKELKKSKHESLNWPFLLPVNAEAWGATDYYQIIAHPMDLSTVERKLAEYEYSNEKEFENDIRLMFTNCYAYNPPEHAVHQLGKKFEHVFESYWRKIHKKASSKAKKDSKRTNKKIRLVANGVENTIHIDQSLSSTPASTLPQPLPQTTPSIEHTLSRQPSEEARPPTILRLKLTTTKPNNETPKSKTPTPPLPETPSTATTNTQPEPKRPKLPGLALSKEPPSDSSRPKLAIGNKTSPPPDKKAPVLLQNHDKWLALAQKSGPAEDLDSPLSTPVASTMSTPSTTSAAPPAPSKPKEAPPAPKTFDITEFIDRMQCENRVRNQQKRTLEEQRKETERVQMEKKQRTIRQQEEQRKEHKEWMDQMKRKDREARMAHLVERTNVDISKQKMVFHKFEANALSRDQDWRDLFYWQRDTVDYRRLPAPGFVRRGHVNLHDLRRQLMTKSVRLRRENGVDNKDYVPMDIE